MESLGTFERHKRDLLPSRGRDGERTGLGEGTGRGQD